MLNLLFDSSSAQKWTHIFHPKTLTFRDLSSLLDRNWLHQHQHVTWFLYRNTFCRRNCKTCQRWQRWDSRLYIITENPKNDLSAWCEMGPSYEGWYITWGVHPSTFWNSVDCSLFVLAMRDPDLKGDGRTGWLFCIDGEDVPGLLSAFIVPLPKRIAEV